MLAEYERKTGVALFINQGQRTLAEQAAFYAAYLRGGTLAARPTPSAPHIKFKRQHHALDINANVARKVAAFYRSHGVPVAFNVAGEPWHMDTLDEAALKRAAKAVTVPSPLRRGHRGASVLKLKRLLYSRGVRNFSSTTSSSRFNPSFSIYTEQAVKRFQKSRNLTPDGRVGPATWRALAGAR